jgi:5,10-methylenetetrahydromethanopterin reductase
LKFSLRLNNDLPVKDYTRIAQAAEAAGFDQFWVSDDLFLRSGPIILAAVACATERIEIGTCIVNPYTIHPAEIAMMAATLDEVSHGRFNLGLSSGAADFLAWIGITAEKPRTAAAEAVHIINRLFAGARVDFRGQVFEGTREAYLRFQQQRRVPIYIGAMSPNMLRLIGEVADGGLPLLFPPEHYENVMPHIQAGAASAGRDLAAVDVAACVWCSVSDDRKRAEDALKDKIAYYGHALSPMILDQLGLTRQDFAAVQQAVAMENDPVKARALVTEAMLRIGIVGTTADLIRRLEKLTALGVQHISLGPPLGPDILEAVALIGRDVIPYFRQGQPRP